MKTWLEEATLMGSGDDSTVAIIYCPEALKQSEKLELSEEAAETFTKTLPANEILPSLAVLTDSETFAPDDFEDVTVTITIKKDKNKLSRTSVTEVAEAETELIKPENKTE